MFTKNPTKNHYLGNLQINQKSQPALKSKEPYTQISKWVLTKSIKQYKTTLKNILKSFLGSVLIFFSTLFGSEEEGEEGTKL